MKILEANHLGFCFGVRRAVAKARDLVESGKSPIYTLGPLIHNSQEIARLAESGVVPRDKIEECTGGPTILRTHGIPREEFVKAKQLGIELVDAICPRVKVPRRHIEQFGREGRTVIVVGDRGHPEVKSLSSFATGSLYVVSKADEIPDIEPPETPLGIVAQTTQSLSAYDSVVAACRARYPDVESVCTICDDASLRQDDALRLAREVDLMLVIGGFHSANTRRLAQICRTVLERTHQVEDTPDLEGIDFSGVEEIGLTSGASTPQWMIEKIEKWLASRLG